MFSSLSIRYVLLQYNISILVNEEKTILILKLYDPAYQLAPFCPEASENYIKIVFEKKSQGICF